MKKLVIIYAALLSWCLGWAQGSPKLHFQHYDTETGMPSNCVRDIEQDADGFIWLATDGGVVRFDSYKFKPYKLNCNDPRKHDDNYPAALHYGAGALWVGTDAHLFRYNVLSDAFEYVPFYDAEGSELRVNIKDIHSDSQGNLWIAIYNRGIAQLIPDNNGNFTFAHYPFDGQQINAMMVDKQDNVWAILSSSKAPGGLYRKSSNEDDFKPFPLAGLSAEMVSDGNALAEDATSALWLGTWEGELLTFDPVTGKYAKHTLTELPLHHIHSIAPLPNGIILIGSEAGLTAYNPRNGHAIMHRHDELSPSSISGEFVYPIFMDKEGGTWVGTFYSGLNYIMPPLKLFDNQQHSKFYNSVSGTIISAFEEDVNGDIYIASDNGGLCVRKHDSGLFQALQLPGISQSNLHALLRVDNALLIGSYTQGVHAMDMNTGRSRLISEPDASCYAMFRDSQNRIWLGLDGKLCQWDGKSILTCRDLDSQIVDIAEEPAGPLWIATQGRGLYCYEPTSGALRNYRYSSAAGALPHDHVYDIEFDQKGDMWLGTSAGLSKFYALADSFSIERAVLPGGSVEAIIHDGKEMWLGTQKGLVKYNPEKKAIELFIRSDGLCSTQFMPASKLKAADGTHYFGTRAGYFSFLPHQVRLNANAPKVAFTDLELDNQPAAINTNLNQIKELQLDSKYNAFSIGFASLSYVNPEKNQFMYKLDGFDQDWIEVGNQHRVTYTNIPPGKYKLMVKGSNSDNIWNNEATVLPITILPAWYKTWPMKAIYWISPIALISLFIMAWMRRAERKHKQQLSRVKTDKEIEIYQAKLSFFTMVAHEIRTPVSLIMGPLEKLLSNPADMPVNANKDLNIIHRNSQRLLFLVNQLLDFKKVEESGMQVKYTHCAVVPLIMSVAERFRPSLEHKGIDLELNINLTPEQCADIDAEAVTKLLSNLMNNARKFTKSKITISACIVGDDRLEISVADDGIGVAKEEQEKIFRPFYQVKGDKSQEGTGLGLSIVRGVADAHNGSISVDSALGRGTKFIIMLPLQQNSAAEQPAPPALADAAVTAKMPETNSTDADDEKPTMLVVDDNEELCQFIANSFEDKYNILTAENGEEALNILSKKQPQLIISDWMMPKLDGVELCQRVRAEVKLSHIPFVLLTAKTDDQSKVQGLNCGADAYVEKPFSLQVLQARILGLLKMRKLLQQKFSQSPLEPIQSLAPHTADNEFLTQLNGIIEENFANPDLDVDFLAEKLSMSRSSLYGKIRSLADVSPNDLIRITRLKHAAKLLAQGQLRVNEVCYRVGFNSNSYFAKCFQKQFGMTPTEFIKTNTP